MTNKQQRNTQAMADAKSWLDEHGIPYQYLQPYQLKIGKINFWPGTGTITIDGELHKRPLTGLRALANLLHDTGAL
jgi:hypothetical protein